MTMDGPTNIGAAHSSATAGIQGIQPQIGGAQVQPGGFHAFKRAISDVGHTIRNFFAKIGSAIEDWQDARAAKAALKETGKARGAAEAVITSLKENGGGANLIKDMSKLMTLAEKLNPGDPQAYASTLLRERLDALPTADRNKIITMDFKALSTVAKAVADDRINKLVGLESALQDQGMTDGVSDGGQMKTEAHQKIDSVLSTLVGVAREARLAELRDKGDGLYNIDNDGNISGVVQNGRLPHGVGGMQQPTALEFVLYDGRQKIQASKTTPISINGTDVPLSDKAIADMPRMDLDLIGTDETYNTHTKPIGESAAKLRAFAGSDSATTVLSGVLAQYPLRELPGALVGNSGKAVMFKSLQSHFDQAIVKLPNGGVATYDHPRQISEAHVGVSKLPNGDFRITVDWAYLATRVGDRTGYTPFDPDTLDHTPQNDTEKQTPQNCMRVHLEAQYDISGTDAANGLLTILPGAVFQHSFAGKAGLPSL